MLSKIYPSIIKFLPNHNDGFVADTLYSYEGSFSSIKPLNPQHSSIPKYTKAVAKLFREIDIDQQNIWIVPLTGTTTVRIYFSNPEFYPVSFCCQKCVYLQIQQNLSGSIICPSCQLILVSFIHYDENTFNDGKISQMQKQRLFRQKKRQNLTKNKVMYENLTSHRYKTKNLKSVLSNYASQSFSSLLASNKQSVFDKPQNTKDGFILELRFENLRSNQNNQEYRNDFDPDKYLIEAGEVQLPQQKSQKSCLNIKSIEQTRQIIFDIFK